MGKRIKIYLALAVAMAFIASQAGCGKKGPPVAPKQKTTAAEKGHLAHLGD